MAKMAQFNKLHLHKTSIIFQLSVDIAVKKVNNTKLKMSIPPYELESFYRSFNDPTNNIYLQ